MQVSISTAVDSLVSLVIEKKRILLEDAARELKVPENIILEWATFLEEEGILIIDYKFSKTYLVVKKDIKKEELEIENLNILKDVLTRKLQYMFKFVETQNIKNSGRIKTIEDIKKLIKDFVFTENNVTNELVYAQKIILISVIKTLIQRLKTVNEKNKNLIIEEIKKVTQWKLIFERNLKELKII